MPPERLLVGRIVGTWGRRGALKVQVLSSFPERFTPGITLLVGPDLQPHAVQEVRWLKGSLLLKLAGVDDLSRAEELVGLELWVPFEARHPLGADEYYLFEILGLQVFAEDGRYLGDVEEVLETPSNDVYVVRGEGREYLLPATKEVVRKIDRERGLMVVRLLPGLE